MENIKFRRAIFFFLSDKARLYKIGGIIDIDMILNIIIIM